MHRNRAGRAGYEHTSASRVRRKVVAWSVGILDLVQVRRSDGELVVFLTRGPASAELCQALSTRSDRQRTAKGIEVAAETPDAVHLLEGSAHRVERAALRRQGMPDLSRRSRAALWALLVVPLLVGLAASVFSYTAGARFFFGHQMVDTIFTFPTVTSAAALVASFFFPLVDRLSSADEDEMRRWLALNGDRIAAGELLVPVPRSPAEQLVDAGAAVEVPEPLVKALTALVDDYPQDLAVPPAEFVQGTWTAAAEWSRALQAAQHRDRILADCRMTETELQELAGAGDSDAAAVTDELDDLGARRDAALEAVTATEARLTSLLDSTVADERRQRLARVRAKVAGADEPTADAQAA